MCVNLLIPAVGGVLTTLSALALAVPFPIQNMIEDRISDLYQATLKAKWDNATEQRLISGIRDLYSEQQMTSSSIIIATSFLIPTACMMTATSIALSIMHNQDLDHQTRNLNVIFVVKPVCVFMSVWVGAMLVAVAINS